MGEHGAGPPQPGDRDGAGGAGPGSNRGWGPPPSGWGPRSGPAPSEGPSAWPGQGSGAQKPGVAPLRPLRLADLLDATFATVRLAPVPTLVQAVVVQVALALLWLLLAYRLDVSIAAVEGTLGRLAAEPDPAHWGAAVSSGLLGNPWQSYALAGAALLAVQLLANVLIAGPATVAGMRAVLGMGTGWGAALVWSAGAMGRMLLWNLLLFLAAALLAGLLAAAALGLGAALGTAAAVLLAAGAGLALLPLLFWAGIRLCLVPTLLVTRKAGIGRAVRESWKLSAGSWWRILGILLVVSVVLGMLGGLGTQVAALAGGELAAAGAGADAGLWVGMLANAVIGALAMVLTQLMLVMLQVDLRIRRDALDAALGAESRAPGAQPIPGCGAPGA